MRSFEIASKVAAAESAALEMLWSVKRALNEQLQGVLGDLTDSLDRRVLEPFRRAASRAGPRQLPEEQVIDVQGLRGPGVRGPAELVPSDEEEDEYEDEDEDDEDFADAEPSDDEE